MIGPGPTPIVGLDCPDAASAMRLVDALPNADFFKVGLQLFTAEGPDIVRALKRRGNRVFLDLKLHDIPNTVAGAVRSAAGLEVDLLTLHVTGGTTMLKAAVDANRADPPTLLFGVTVLTSLDAGEAAAAWGRERVEVGAEVTRLAQMAASAGLAGVVSSVHEVPFVRSAAPDLLTLTPGIRLPGADPGDQARVATPADAVRAGASFLVLGRTVTAAPDPAEALDRVLSDLASPAAR